MMKSATIINSIPHKKPFLFVDEIIDYSDQHIIGEYTFPKSADFFNGHFPEKSLVPGVLITECAAQIGLACFGFILQGISTTSSSGSTSQLYLTHSQMDFEQPVEPEERLRVEAELDYFRFQKLSVKVKIYVDDNRAANGKLQGMVFKT